MIVVEIVENQTPNLCKIVYSFTHWVTITHIQGVFCILITQLLKFLKDKIEIAEPSFYKYINSWQRSVDCQ